jgi:hypothetical protein
MVELVAVLQDREVASLPRHLVTNQLGLLPSTGPTGHAFASKEDLAADDLPTELGRELRDISQVQVLLIQVKALGIFELEQELLELDIELHVPGPSLFQGIELQFLTKFQLQRGLRHY